MFAELEDAREEWEQAFNQRLREITDQLDALI
jgi:hypothetical protein